jgi:hypothetical protein
MCKKRCCSETQPNPRHLIHNAANPFPAAQVMTLFPLPSLFNSFPDLLDYLNNLGT